MKVLIAEDDHISRLILKKSLQHWGYEVIETCDGNQAWQELQADDHPRIAIIDWMMPEMDGIELCYKVRESLPDQNIYLILLTTKNELEDIVEGLQSGADDYIVKPFQPAELQARLNVGIRMVTLQTQMSNQVKALEDALAHVKQLQGMLPICCYCKKIRDDKNYWLEVEDYLSKHSSIYFSHGYCPDCYQKKMQEFAEQKRRSQAL